MKGQLAVATPEAYLAALPEERRSEVVGLDARIRALTPQLTPVIHDGMLGYGPFRYRYASGREGASCRLLIASNASAVSLYVMAADGDGYLAERFKDRLPKAKIGKSCVRFRRLADLDGDALDALITAASQMTYGDTEV